MSRYGAVFVSLLWLGTLPACRQKESDENRIRRIFVEAAKAAEEKRVSDAVKDLSDRFRSEDLDKDGAKRLVAQAVLRGGWLAATVSGSSIRVEGDRALAVVDVVLARLGGRSLASLAPGEATVYRFELSLEREDDGWKILKGRFGPVGLEDALNGPPEPSFPGPP